MWILTKEPGFSLEDYQFSSRRLLIRRICPSKDRLISFPLALHFQLGLKSGRMAFKGESGDKASPVEMLRTKEMLLCFQAPQLAVDLIYLCFYL